MKKLITSSITGDVGAPFTQPSVDNLQANFGEIPDAIIKGLLGSYTTNDVIVLYGVVVTLSTVTTSNDTATWTAGAIYYNGEVYQVAAGTLTKTSGVFLYSINDAITNEIFDDGNSYPWIEVRTVTITSGTSGTGIADYGASTVSRLNDYTNTGFTASAVSNLTSASIGSITARRKNGRITYTGWLVGELTTSGSAVWAQITCPQGFKMTPSSSALGDGVLITQSGNTGYAMPPDDISADAKVYVDGSNNLQLIIDVPTGTSGSFVYWRFTLTRDSI